jgi:hypothetical protein
VEVAKLESGLTLGKALALQDVLKHCVSIWWWWWGGAFSKVIEEQGE